MEPSRRTRLEKVPQRRHKGEQIRVQNVAFGQIDDRGRLAAMQPNLDGVRNTPQREVHPAAAPWRTGHQWSDLGVVVAGTRQSRAQQTDFPILISGQPPVLQSATAAIAEMRAGRGGIAVRAFFQN